MADDIVTRLDEAYESLLDIGGAVEREVVRDAIAEIERLRAELEQVAHERAWAESQEARRD